MMNWEDCVRKRSWLNLKALSPHLPGRIEETTKNFSQDSRSPGRYLNPGPHEYKARLLTTRPWLSVLGIIALDTSLGGPKCLLCMSIFQLHLAIKILSRTVFNKLLLKCTNNDILWSILLLWPVCKGTVFDNPSHWSAWYGRRQRAPNVVVEWLTLLLRFRKVAGFKPRPGDRIWQKNFVGFLSTSKQMPG
jgi:hypothetical protein